jgi:two-component SAPR family response regulator
LKEAQIHAEQALAPYQDDTLVYEVYVCRSVLADLLLDANQLGEAKAIFQILIELGEKQQYQIPLAMAYFGLAYISLYEKQVDSALELSRKSIALLEPAMMPQLYLDQHERAFVVCDMLYRQMPDNEFVEQVYITLAAQKPQVEPLVIEAPRTHVIEIRTLGNFRVLRNDVEINPKAFASAKGRDLLAYFVNFRYKSIPIERAMESLWPDGSGSHSAFHTALYRMRVALRDKEETEKYVLSEMGEYRLDSARFSIDVDQFNSLLKRARSANEENSATFFESALSLYKGEYLDSLYYDWLTLEREKLQRQYINAARDLSHLKENSGLIDEALHWMHQALHADPYQEIFHADLMRLLHRAGDRQQLIQHYQNLKIMLKDTFDSDPLPETRLLYERLMTEK